MVIQPISFPKRDNSYTRMKTTIEKDLGMKHEHILNDLKRNQTAYKYTEEDSKLEKDESVDSNAFLAE